MEAYYIYLPFAMEGIKADFCLLIKDVFVKGDRDANYGFVMKAMVLLQKAGAVNVGLVTQNPTSDATS